MRDAGDLTDDELIAACAGEIRQVSIVDVFAEIARREAAQGHPLRTDREAWLAASERHLGRLPFSEGRRCPWRYRD